MSANDRSGEDARLHEVLARAVSDVTPQERRPADLVLSRADRWRWLHGVRGALVALLTLSLAGGGVAVAASQLNGDDPVVRVAPAPSQSSAVGRPTPACPYNLHVTPTDPPVDSVVARGEPLAVALLPTATDFGSNWEQGRPSVVDDLPAHPDIFDQPSPPEAAAQERSLVKSFQQHGVEPHWSADVTLMRYEPAYAQRAFRTFADAELGCSDPELPERTIVNEDDVVISELAPDCGGPCSVELSTAADTSARIHAVAVVGDVVAFADFEMDRGRYQRTDLDRIAQELTAVVFARLKGEVPPPGPELVPYTTVPASQLLQGVDVPQYFHVGNAPHDGVGPPPLRVALKGCQPVTADAETSLGHIYRSDDVDNNLRAWRESIYQVGDAAAAAFLAKLKACAGVTPVPGIKTGVAFFDPETEDNNQPFPGLVVASGGQLVRLQVLQYYDREDGQSPHPVKAELGEWLARVAAVALKRLSSG